MKKIIIFSLIFLFVPLITSAGVVRKDTGWKSPTLTGTYYSEWNNPENAYEDDGDYATAFPSGAWLYQSYENFNINISSGAVILGIEVKTKGYSSPQRSVQIALFPPNESWITKSQAWQIEEGEYITGGENYLWLRDWTPEAFLNENFRSRIQTGSKTAGDLYYLNHIQIRVHYEEEEVPAPTGIIAITSDFVSTALGYISTLFADLWVIIALIIGLPLGFWAIRKVISLARPDNSKKIMEKEERLKLLEKTEKKVEKEKEMMLAVLKAKRTRKKEDILKAEELLDKGLKDNWL